MYYIIVFFISMVPLIELRGAIPYAIAQGLPYVPSYIIAILGNMLPVPFIYLFARKVLLWGADKPVIGKFFTYCIEKGEKGGKKLQATAGKGLFVALLLFVGIPLPGTGAWTGTLAASFLDMDFKSSIIAVMLGVMLAGIIMGLASAGIVMVKRNIVLGNVANVQEFNRICGHMDFDVDLAQGKYLVDAKSIMGIFSLDMEKPLELCANTNDEALIDEKFKAFIQ